MGACIIWVDELSGQPLRLRTQRITPARVLPEPFGVLSIEGGPKLAHPQSSWFVLPRDQPSLRELTQATEPVITIVIAKAISAYARVFELDESR